MSGAPVSAKQGGRILEETILANRQPIDARATGMMLLLCGIWGMQQIALKAVADDMAPMLQIGLRSGLAAVLIWLFVRLRGERLAVRRDNWRAGLLAGILFALEYLFVGEGLRFTSASHSVVFLYTAPIFAALGLHWRVAAERLAPGQWLGIGLAFAGICIAFFLRPAMAAAGAGAALFGDALALAGGAAWGATTVVVRCSRLADTPATATAFYQLLCAFCVLTLAAWLTGQGHIDWTVGLSASLAYQVLLVSFFSFLLWFWLLQRYLASRLGAFSFLTPLFGVVLGIGLLDEPLQIGFVIGAVLVLVGITLVTTRGHRVPPGGSPVGSKRSATAPTTHGECQ